MLAHEGPPLHLRGPLAHLPPLASADERLRTAPCQASASGATSTMAGTVLVLRSGSSPVEVGSVSAGEFGNAAEPRLTAVAAEAAVAMGGRVKPEGGSEVGTSHRYAGGPEPALLTLGLCRLGAACMQRQHSKREVSRRRFYKCWASAQCSHEHVASKQFTLHMVRSPHSIRQARATKDTQQKQALLPPFSDASAPEASAVQVLLVQLPLYMFLYFSKRARRQHRCGGGQRHRVHLRWAGEAARPEAAQIGTLCAARRRAVHLLHKLQAARKREREHRGREREREHGDRDALPHTLAAEAAAV